MYEENQGSGGHKVIVLVIALITIVAVGACIKIVLDHVGADGMVTSSSDSCENEEGMDALEKAGVFGGARPRCEKKDEQSEE